MGFVPQATQQGHAELIRLTLQWLTFAGEENLLPLFGQRADVEVLVQIEFPQCLHHRRELSFAAIDHHHIRPVVEAVGLQGTATFVAQGTHIDTISLGAGPTPETPAHDLGHGHEVIAVAGLDAAAADLVFAVVLLGGQSIDEHHLRGHGIAALDVTDVVALDPSRRRRQLQQLSQILGG